MIIVTADITGADALIARLNDAPTIAEAELRAALEPFAGEIADELADYPSPPPNSTYQRTDDLGRGWRTAGQNARATVQGGSVVVVIQNDAIDYDPFVQGKDQAPIHQGRWRLASAIATQAQADIAGVGADVARRIGTKITGG